MKKLLLVLLSCLLISPALAETNWKELLKKDAVKLKAGKMQYEQYEVCNITSKKGEKLGSFQVKTLSEAPDNDFISRDNFLIFTTMISSSLNEIKSDCQDVERAIGNPDIVLSIHMTPEGIQSEFINTKTGEKSRDTNTWKALFAE